MNFGWFNDNTEESDFCRTTLHEFGHALGCIHEQLQPQADIKWNKGFVYEYYEKLGWTRTDIDLALFQKYNSAETINSDYDPLSIMQYPLPPGFTTNGFVVGWNNQLSQTDIDFIRKIYPSVISAKLETGTFNTMDVRPWQNPQAHTTGTVQLSSSNTFPPSVLLGVNSLDMNILRIKSHIQKVTNSSITIDMESWGDTVQYSSGCSWLSIPRGDPDIQFGRFNTMDDHPWTRPKKSTTRKITFNPPYLAPPKVVVWLESGDTGAAQNCRIITKAENITTDSFIIHIDTWSDTNIWSGGASWLSYSAHREDIRSGTFNTQDVRAWDRPQLLNSARISFDGGAFLNTPGVFAALNSLDIERGRNIRIKLRVTDVTTSGMTWHLDSWGDTIQYSSGGSYIAFAQ